MNWVHLLSTQTGPRAGAPHLVADPMTSGGAPLEEEGIGGLPSDRDFVAMQLAYRPTGGLLRGDDLALVLRDRQRGDYVSLARLIVSGEIFSFEWHDTFWIPMFQFELKSLDLKPGPRQVLGELSADFDGWSLAVWFAHPNSWLNERRPVDLVDTDLASVLRAARADRYIAVG
jgi:hypothetical protein